MEDVSVDKSGNVIKTEVVDKDKYVADKLAELRLCENEVIFWNTRAQRARQDLEDIGVYES